MNKATNNSRGVVILGATSGIARALAAEFASHGWALVLAARDTTRTEAIARDLNVRWESETHVVALEALEYETHEQVVEAACEKLGERLEGVVFSLGNMPPQEEAEREFEVARSLIDVNLNAGISLLNRFANKLAERGHGWICGISSVAGDRGRMSNYIYGAAKAGFTAYLAGMRQRLYHRGVHVVTVKPGPVDTPMTQGMENLPLLAQPEAVARQIYAGIEKRKNVIYTPGAWRWIMKMIRAIPEWQFKRMKM